MNIFDPGYVISAHILRELRQMSNIFLPWLAHTDAVFGYNISA